MDRKMIRVILGKLNNGDIVTIKYRDGSLVKSVFRKTAKIGRAVIGIFDSDKETLLIGTAKNYYENVASIILPTGAVFGALGKPEQQPVSTRPEVAARLYDRAQKVLEQFLSGQHVRVAIIGVDGSRQEGDVVSINKIRGRRKQIELRVKNGRKSYVIRTWRDSGMIDDIQIIS